MDTIPAREGPWASFSLGELVGLVAGFALAFSFWPSNWAIIWFSGLVASNGLLVARGMVAAILLAPVVLMPVVVVQRMRHGDLPRPAEWLLLTMAAYRLGLGFLELEGHYYWWLMERTGGYVQVGGLLFRLSVKGFAMVLCLAGLVAFLMARRLMSPAGTTAAVVALGTLAIVGPVLGLGWELDAWLWARMPDGLRPTTNYALRFALQGLLAFPIVLVFAVPLLATLRDRGRDSGRRWTECAAVALACAVGMVWLLDEAVAAGSSLPPIGGLPRFLEWMAYRGTANSGVAVSLPFAWWLVSRYRARWDGWLLGGYDGRHRGMLPAEA